MINKLTPEQEALMPVVRDEWIKFALGGDTPVDQVKAKEGVEWIYSLAKLEKPKFIAFAEGPMAAQMIAQVFPSVCKGISVDLNKNSVRNSVRNSVWNSVENSVRNSVENSVENSVWNSVENSVRNSVRNSVWNSVENSVENSVWNSVWNSVENSVRNSVENSVENSVWNSVENSVRNSVENSVENSVWNSVENSVRNSVRNSVWNSVENYEYPYDGCQWAGYYAFYDFWKRCGITTPEYERLESLIRTGIWEFLWFQDLCVVVCRPSKVMKNTAGQLHNESGPAVEWPSDEKYWFLNGINVPDWLVTTDAGKIDPKKALTEKNVDIQREIIRKVGAERMLKAAKAKTLDVFTDSHTKGGNEYKLMEMTLGENIRRKYLYFEHASFPNVFYAHPVHPQLTKAIHARAWMLSIGEVPELEKMTESELRESLPCEVA